jgi:hypothetical protein
MVQNLIGLLGIVVEEEQDANDGTGGGQVEPRDGTALGFPTSKLAHSIRILFRLQLFTPKDLYKSGENCLRAGWLLLPGVETLGSLHLFLLGRRRVRG